MELARNTELEKNISWGSIIAGVVTVVAVSLLLTTLGTSLGLSMLSPQSDDVINGADKAVLAWSVVSVVLSLGCGGFVAGRLAGTDGTIHGFLSWATSLLVVSLLGFAVAGGILNMAGSAIGTAASVTGSTVSGLSTAAVKATGVTANIGQNIAESIGFDTNLSKQHFDRQIIDTLRKSNIKELQPEYLQSQLESAGKDLTAAVKDLVLNPGNSDKILNDLIDQLQSRAEKISNSVNRGDVKKALAQNTSLSSEDADKAVNNFIEARDRTVSEVKERLAQLESKLDEAKVQYAELKQQVIDQADIAAHAGARIALWSFFGLLIGAVISSLAGFWGVNTHRAIRKVRA